MTSVLKVDNIQNSSGTSALEIDSSGNVIPAASGSVLQMVTKLDTDYDEIETTSTSFTTTGMSISITPKKSDSKILVRFDFNADNGGSNSSVMWTIYRGSTNLKPSDVDAIVRVHDLGSRILANQTAILVDEPNTTNEVTYTLYHRVNSGGPVRTRNDLTQMVMTLTEISA